MTTRVGVDTGGTFTDVVVLQANGAIAVRKLPSTPADPSQSVLTGITECLAAGEITLPYSVVHGTTVATNALLQRRGAATALITTRGFRDLLSIGRQTRSQLYALHPRKPIPLLARTDCYEVEERLDWQGQVLTPLDMAQAETLLNLLKARNIHSLAICFLFSYLNPVHERALGSLALAHGFDVSLSCDIAPEPREYERASTTVANAFVAPLMTHYLTNLQSELRRLQTAHLRIMQSNGGALSAEEAAHHAIMTALSGPAGGVVAAVQVGSQAGFTNILTFDMGGTSTDVALIVDGQCPVVTNGLLGDLPLRTPQLAIHTVGAGGGSLVRVDQAGGLRVGPQSAGAEPGPVAYGLGNTLTVTDANVLLGRLPENIRLGGRVPLDAARVRDRFAALALQLGLPQEEAALGILAVANATMARALRHVSVERGHDPSRFTLLSFGGAGGLHACALARALDIQSILIPRYPGAFSALGLALADARREYVRALPPARLDLSRDMERDLGNKTANSIGLLAEPEESGRKESSVAELLARLIRELQAESNTDRIREGFSEEEWQENALLDLRYVGQSFELRVPLSTFAMISQAVEDFHVLHTQRFGYADTLQPVEVTAVRLIAVGKSQISEQIEQTRAEVSLEEGETQETKDEHTHVYGENSWEQIPLYHRAKMVLGQLFSGPALIIQEDATTYVSPEWQGYVDRNSNLILSHIN